MAHFAQLNENNVVTQIIVVNNNKLIDENGNESEELGIKFCQSLFGVNTRWVQTSYNGNFRKNYAGKGFSYNQKLDAFIPPSPYPSWVLNESTLKWESPIPRPNDEIDIVYQWNEKELKWDQIILE